MNESDKITHLLRRVGFAARPEEIEQAGVGGLVATVHSLINFENTPDNLAPSPPGLASSLQTFSINETTQWWLNAMMTTTRPLQEKMVLFWHGLFATSTLGVGNSRQMYLQNEHFRGNFSPDTGQLTRPTTGSPFPLGNFRAMLESLTKDPAMLYWLDNRLNSKLSNEVGSNENYARELLELFSLGVRDVVTQEPNYTERDVRQASRALTGWHVDEPTFAPEYAQRFAFNSDQHDPGPYEVLGVTFRGTGQQLFDIIVRHRNPGQPQRAAGRFLGYRLFKFFGYDDPEPEIINALADVFDGRNGEDPFIVRNLLQTMFTPGNIVSEAFYSEKAFRGHVKSPTEYVVSLFRLLRPTGLGQDPADQIFTAMRQMGQSLFFPPDVSGWKEGLNWINTTFMFARYNLAHEIITQQYSGLVIDVNRLVADNNLQMPEQLVDYFAQLLLQVTLSVQTRETLVQYLLSNASGPFDVNDQATLDNKVRGLIFLIITRPEFQLS